MSQHVGGTVVLPTEPVITHRSELFDVKVTHKYERVGVTRTTYILLVEILERDPLLFHIAEVVVDEETYKVIDKGDVTKLRAYEHPNGNWRPDPPKAGLIK